MCRLVCFIFCLSACQIGSTSLTGGDFLVQLTPVVPAGHEVFIEDAELTVLRWDDGAPQTIGGSSSSTQTWQFDELHELEQTSISLLVTRPGFRVEPIDWTGLLGHGRTQPLDIQTGTLDAPIWVPAFGAIGDMGELPAAQRAFAPAVTMMPDGSIYLFGGSDAATGAPLTGPARSQVLRLERTQLEPTFLDVGVYPTPTGALTAHVGSSANTVTLPEGPAIVLAGGREQWIPANNGRSTIVVWDPETQEIAIQSSMSRARSLHVAELDAAGRVLMLGGYDGSGITGRFDYEWFDPQQNATSDAQEIPGVFDLGFGWANMGAQGVMVCGGGAQIRSGDTFETTGGCAVIGTDGVARPREDIASGVSDATSQRMWHAMTHLTGGMVLVTGGVSGVLREGEATGATADAFLFDPSAPTDAWRRLPDMLHPRAMHRMLALPDGRAIVFGGTLTGIGPGAPVLGEPSGCPELFDPASERFEQLPCTEAALGALPAVASAPGYDAWLLAGFDSQGGGRAWGITGLGPTSP